MKSSCREASLYSLETVKGTSKVLTHPEFSSISNRHSLAAQIAKLKSKAGSSAA